MSTLPKDVKRSIDRANKDAESIVAARKTAGDAKIASLVTPEPPAPPVEAKPDATPPTPAPETPPPSPPAPVEDDWRTKYEVLQGKYNAEVPRLSKQVRGMNEELDRVRTILASSQTTAPETSAVNTAPVNKQSYLTPQEIEEYGTELIDIVKRAAKEEIYPEIDYLKKENQSLKSQLGSVNEKVVLSDREKIFSKLDAQVKDWRRINEDESFLGWLNEVDPYSGLRRQQMLSNAFNSNDADRVSAFFTGYLREHAVLDANTSQPAPIPREPIVDLGSLAAPGRNRTVPNDGAPQGQRIWTQAEIAEFYRDIQKGRYTGREKDRLNIERSIFAASKKGLVR